MKQKVESITARIKKINLSKIKPAKPGSVLVFESTGAALWGVCARRGVAGNFVFSTPAVSPDVDFAAAVKEVLTRLRERTKGRLPKSAVIVMPSAAGELLSLPVDPRKPLAPEQMGEMIRWELEELFVRQGNLFSLGGLLQGRGALSPQRRREIETAAEQNGVRAGVDVFKDAVTDAQLDDCLILQEALSEMDDELSTGWLPMAADGETGQSTWYCAGIGEALRARWVEAFKKNGLNCNFIYPQLGTMIPLVDASEEWLLVDVRQEQFGLFQGNGGRIEAVSRGACPHGTADPEAISEAAARFMHPATKFIGVSAPDDRIGPIMEALNRATARWQITISPVGASIDAGPDFCPLPLRTSLEGTARHFLGRRKPDLLVRIRTQAPRPPVWKNRQLWPWAAMVLVVAGITANEIWMHKKTAANEWALELADIEYNRNMKILNEASQTNSEATKLEKTLAEKEKALADQERLRTVLDSVIRYRQTMIPGVLRDIAGAMNGGVALDVLSENDDRSGFYLEGWAVKNTRAQRFGTDLNEALADWGYKVGDLKLERDKGRLDMDGYVFNIWLVKTTGKGSGK